MVIVNASNLRQATKDAYFQLLASIAVVDDPEVWKEEPAVLVVTDPTADNDAVDLGSHGYKYTKNYSTFFPEVDNGLMQLEENHWQQVLYNPHHAEIITTHLKDHPYSRRALSSMWTYDYLDLSKGGACLTELYFRTKNGSIELHSHSRANDAYRLLLLDMQVATAIQRIVAAKLKKPVESYIHFVDALRFYKKYESNIKKLAAYMQTAAAWNTEA